jgi:hypothetical protein
MKDTTQQIFMQQAYAAIVIQHKKYFQWLIASRVNQNDLHLQGDCAPFNQVINVPWRDEMNMKMTEGKEPKP